MRVNIKLLFENLLPWFLLTLIALIAAIVRTPTLTAPTILDYDPFWYYRHAIEIMNNNMKPLKWDLLSYYPPGRPFDTTLGMEYIMIFFYKLAQLVFNNISFLTVAKWSPIILVCLGAIPAYLFGKLLTNKWGGLATALFALLTPTFIGVSMGGYCDNDPVVVFFIFLSIYSIFLALKKRSLPYYLFAVLSNLLFVFSWGGGWFVLILFAALVPAIALFRFAESAVHNFNFKINLSAIAAEVKPLLVPLLIIIIVTNIIASLSGLGNMFTSFLVLLGFINPQQGLLVNISVAELQPINVLSQEGILAVANRVGLLPTLLTFIGLPIFVLYKLYKKIKIDYTEIFFFMLALTTFVMIIHGVRFSIEFSIAAAVVAGYIIGNLNKYPRISMIILALVLVAMSALDRTYLWPMLIFSIVTIFTLAKPSQQEYKFQLFTAYGLLFVIILIFITNATQLGISSTGMEISQNWLDSLDWLKANADKDSLITTWWDPGHIIAGYTGLKVMADGAHCGPAECIPYNHNIRIVDMGRTFSTSNETEAVSILSKYMQLTPEQCAEARKNWTDSMPKDACKPVSEMYIIASNDLIGKYYWLSYFGSYDEKTKAGTGRNFIQLQLTNYNQQQGILQYGNGIISLMLKDNKLVAVFNLPQQGVRNAVVKDIIFFQNGKQINRVVENFTIDGLVIVDPSFQVVTFLEQPVRDSIYTNMFFFNGEGSKDFGIPKLNHFKLEYSNPEVKIFKVIF
jgi:dolichyl-diphosphooligosaccharide--protein glycosyltransferase